jgi:hypothetical protein
VTFALFVRAVCKTSNEMARMQSGRVRLAISPAKLVRYRDRRVLVISQIAMQRGHYLSTLADCRRDPLDRTGTNIADREDAGASSPAVGDCRQRRSYWVRSFRRRILLHDCTRPIDPSSIAEAIDLIRKRHSKNRSPI